VKSVWTLVSPSLVLQGRHVMLFHREASSASVHLEGRGSCAKTVSEFSLVTIVILLGFPSFHNSYLLIIPVSPLHHFFKCLVTTVVLASYYILCTVD